MERVISFSFNGSSFETRPSGDGISLFVQIIAHRAEFEPRDKGERYFRESHGVSEAAVA